ncbi:MAG: translation initiation factor 2 [Lachnospiraceae bacterium]|nr:translation initiation factor 2 [Lachnospiraceae bacterium]
MKGKHHILIETESLRYEFDVRRNITVLQGESATGKTTLIDILAEYSKKGRGGGIRVQSDVPCFVFNGSADRWMYELGGMSGGVIFIDEDYRFIQSNEFAEYLAHSDNYYVLVTRKPLYNLPYSINEIYGIRTSGKYHFPEKIYHEFYPIYGDNYGNISDEKRILLLIEDKEAGYDFFKDMVGDGRCMSAEGNAGIYPRIIEIGSSEDILLIADGAAFGSYVDKVVHLRQLRGHIAIYFPESFEWMVLKSGIIKGRDILNMLESPEEYIDSKEYMSWERFFTALLIELTKDDPIKRYSKSGITDFYRGQNAEKILGVMPEEIRRLI